MVGEDGTRTKFIFKGVALKAVLVKSDDIAGTSKLAQWIISAIGCEHSIVSLRYTS